MRDNEGFDNAAGLLPQDMRQTLSALPGAARACAEELRLRSGRRPSLLLAEGESPFGDIQVAAPDSRTGLE